VVEYYHRAVVAHLIGFDRPLVLDVEPIAPGEGEGVAAERLVERLVRHYPRFFDALVADAAYLQRPFLERCRRHGKHVLAVLKQNNPALLQEARALLNGPPQWEGTLQGRQTRLWDQEGFSIDSPALGALRIIRSEETTARRRRIDHQWVHEPLHAEWFWATTIPQELLPARQLCQIGHERWSIENRVFNHLGAHWSLNHCFHHRPAAIVNFWLILFMAHTWIGCFAARNLKPPLREQLSLIEVARLILIDLASLGRWRAPWLDLLQRPPP